MITSQGGRRRVRFGRFLSIGFQWWCTDQECGAESGGGFESFIHFKRLKKAAAAHAEETGHRVRMDRLSAAASEVSG